MLVALLLSVPLFVTYTCHAHPLDTRADSVLSYVAPDNQVKCFCDKFHCPNSNTCIGKWCLIGVRSDGEGMDQICGWDDSERPVTCAYQSWHKWSEVCACETPFCNTFAFLRNSIDGGQQKMRRGESGEELYFGDMDNNEFPTRTDSRTAVTNRVGGWTGWHKSGNIVVLLIVMPLCVGGFAVLFVFLNYHCKMT